MDPLIIDLIKPFEEPIQPFEEPIRPFEESIKPLEESIKPLEENPIHKSDILDFSKRLPTIHEVSTESLSSKLPEEDMETIFSYDMYAKCYSSDLTDDLILFNHLPNQIIPDAIMDTRHTLDKTVKSHTEIIEQELSHHIVPNLPYCFCCSDDSVIHDNVCNWKF
jgi:hypothetical protein